MFVCLLDLSLGQQYFTYITDPVILAFVTSTHPLYGLLLIWNIYIKDISGPKESNRPSQGSNTRPVWQADALPSVISDGTQSDFKQNRCTHVNKTIWHKTQLMSSLSYILHCVCTFQNFSSFKCIEIQAITCSYISAMNIHLVVSLNQFLGRNCMAPGDNDLSPVPTCTT